MMRDGLGGVSSVALIGATSEIGLAIAKALKADRHVLAGRSSASITRSAADLPVDSVVELDMTDVTSHVEAVDKLFEGQDLDVIVLSAGVLKTDPNPDEIAQMVMVNGSGAISLLALLGSRLKEQGHGHLVVLSSVAVVRPRPSNFWYGASKVGLDFAARGLADQLEDAGVQISIVRPGFVHTRMTKGMRAAPFACTPEQVADAVATAVHTNVGGVVWVPTLLKWVALVLRWLPRPLLHRLDR